MSLLLAARQHRVSVSVSGMGSINAGGASGAWLSLALRELAQQEPSIKGAVVTAHVSEKHRPW